MPASSQSTSSCGRADEQVEQAQRVGADACRGYSSGATRLPLDFDIFVAVQADHALGEQAGERLAQVLGRDAEVGQRLGEEAGVHQVQDGVLDAADVLVDRHPRARPPPSRTGASAFHGSQKRRKYQDESTNVSIVSVSRTAGTAALGTRRVQEALVELAAATPPSGRNSTSSGASTGSSSSGTGTMPWSGQ